MIEKPSFRSYLNGELWTTARPGYDAKDVPLDEVEEWCARVKQRGIKTILCLLDKEQLAYYKTLEVKRGLLGYYRLKGFKVIHRPVKDHCKPPVPESVLKQILSDFQTAQRPLLVHCSAGKDRSGSAAQYIQDHL